MAKAFVIEADAVEVGKTRPVTVEGRKLLVCHSKTGIYVIENQCSHQMARLTGGKLRGHKIFCPLHSAPFDMRDGAALGPPADKPICVFQTSVEDGKVFAEIPDTA